MDYSNGDNFRESADLKINRVAYTKTRPMPHMSDDEAYLRLGIPDGLQNDGKQCEYIGICQHDNGSVIQHNSNEPTEDQRAAMSQTRGKIAAGIQDPDERRRYVARQGALEAAGKLDSSAMEDLKSENYRQQNIQAAMPVVDNKTTKIVE
jgi:hypothetical protein